MSDFDDFMADYQDRLDDVLYRSSYGTFAATLAYWLNLIDTSQMSRDVIEDLDRRSDFDSWYAAAQQTVGGMVGSGTLNWATDQTERLAQRLALIRHLASDQDAYVDFAANFMWAGKALDEAVRKINAEIIEPFGRDLLKVIERSRRAQLAPAADRVVPLNHNAPEFETLSVRLAELEKTISTSNSLQTEEDFDRNLAELSASRRLLQAARVRVDALRVVVVSCLRWFAAKTVETAVVIGITAIAVLLASMFGITIPGLS